MWGGQWYENRSNVSWHKIEFYTKNLWLKTFCFLYLHYYFLSSKCTSLCTCTGCNNGEEVEEEVDESEKIEESDDEDTFEERGDEIEHESEDRNFLDIFSDENDELFEEI